ncbi:helix-turn-helix domain-containing protein [Pseudomonas brenneri]|uniref:helix-turn-helix domain-containing protein n=1 Tax=Pseudomonas brenneri TaxID=129817 RepID=UPI0035717010
MATGHSSTLSKGLRLLQVLLADGGRSTLSTVSERAGMPLPTAHRLALLQTLTRFPRLGSCTVKVSCDERFQRTAFYRRGHPMGGALVLSIRHQLP